MSEHIVKSYDEELATLQKGILSMGSMVAQMISIAMQALMESNGSLARHVIEADHEVNLKELEIDKLAVNLLAMRQPVARDLRLILMATKVNTDLERIGDIAVNLSERVLELLNEPQLKPYVDLPRMAEMAQAMLGDALEAFVQGDVEKARLVMEQDDAIDALYAQIFRELLTHMLGDPATMGRSIRLLFVAKYLERIADHVTNLAEMVTYFVDGEDIRHLRSQERR